MPRKKMDNTKKDTRMIASYFKELDSYYDKYGENTILLWQCGGFYEIYCVEDPNTKKRLLSKFDEYLEITHMNSANKNLHFSHQNIDMPVKMAGFKTDDYFLNKYTTILVNEGYTVPVWHETGSDGKGGKTRAELHVFSPGTNFSVEKKEDTNNIVCYTIVKNNYLGSCPPESNRDVTGKTLAGNRELPRNRELEMLG